MSYPDLCESVFRRWLDGELTLSPWASALLDGEEEDGQGAGRPLALCPEPYVLCHGESPSVALVSGHPGPGGQYHRRRCIDAPNGWLRSDSWHANALRLGRLYMGDRQDVARPEGIRQMADLARRLAATSGLAYDGFVRLALLPFHDAPLGREPLDRMQGEIPAYTPALARHLERFPAACAIAREADPDLLSAFARVLDLELDEAEHRALTDRRGRPTAGLYVQRRGRRIRAIACPPARRGARGTLARSRSESESISG
jgi:hypothetical protein